MSHPGEAYGGREGDASDSEQHHDAQRTLRLAPSLANQVESSEFLADGRTVGKMTLRGLTATMRSDTSTDAARGLNCMQPRPLTGSQPLMLTHTRAALAAQASYPSAAQTLHACTVVRAAQKPYSPFAAAGDEVSEAEIADALGEEQALDTQEQDSAPDAGSQQQEQGVQDGSQGVGDSTGTVGPSIHWSVDIKPKSPTASSSAQFRRRKRQLAELAARCRRLDIADMIWIAVTSSYPVKEIRRARLRNEVWCQPTIRKISLCVLHVGPGCLASCNIEQSDATEPAKTRKQLDCCVVLQVYREVVAAQQASQIHHGSAQVDSPGLSPSAALHMINEGTMPLHKRSGFHANVVVFHEQFDRAYVSRLTTRLEQHHARQMDGAIL